MRSIIYALAAAVCTALTVSKGDTSENPVRLTFVNVCKAPVEIFWLAHDGKGQATEEVHKGSIPMNEARDLATSVGQTWRIKWADHQIYEENHFGKHVLEEHVIESDPGMNQEIRICWRARQRAAQQDL